MSDILRPARLETAGEGRYVAADGRLVLARRPAGWEMRAYHPNDARWLQQVSRAQRDRNGIVVRFDTMRQARVAIAAMLHDLPMPPRGTLRHTLRRRKDGSFQASTGERLVRDGDGWRFVARPGTLLDPHLMFSVRTVNEARAALRIAHMEMEIIPF